MGLVTVRKHAAMRTSDWTN